MSLSTSKLRENIYRILDEILETGVPVEVERRGRRLKIIPVEVTDKLSNLPAHPDFLRGDPEDIVSLDWSGNWQP